MLGVLSRSIVNLYGYPSVFLLYNNLPFSQSVSPLSLSLSCAFFLPLLVLAALVTSLYFVQCIIEVSVTHSAEERPG